MISMAIALFLINAPFLAAQALRVVIAGWFSIDAIRCIVAVVRSRESRERSTAALGCHRQSGGRPAILLARGWLLTWVVAIAGALRIFGITWSILVEPVYTSAESDEAVVAELGLVGRARGDGDGRGDRRGRTGARRRSIARGRWSFIATLFAIHIGRMSTDLTLLGLLSPAVAVAGDMLIAVLITLLVINPIYLLWRSPTRWIERLAVALAAPASRQSPRLDRSRRGRLAALAADDGDPAARAALFDSGDALASDCGAGCRSPRLSPRRCRSGA